MHALLSHAMWVHRQLPVAERKGFAVMPEVQRVIEQRLDHETEKTRAIRSVYGQYFHYLCQIDSTWTQQHLAAIFPQSAEQKGFHDAAWNTYVTFNQPRVDAFRILAAQYERAVDNLAEPKGTEHDVGNPDESLAQHLIILYWWKVLDIGNDGLFDRFYAAASDELRGHVVDFVGRAIERDKTPLPEEFKARLMAFWEWRLSEIKQRLPGKVYEKELLGFSWWLYSKKLDPGWLLAQTADVLRLCKAIDHEFLFTKSFAHFSAELPLEAVTCLSLLVDKLRSDRSFVLDREEVQAVLKAAFESNDPEAVQTAATVRDSLLARGNFGFRDSYPPAKHSTT